MKKLFVLITIIVSSLILANYTDAETVISENFIVYDYDVDINVDESKKSHVTESISVYFLSPSHGLIRNIPIVYDVTRSDGSGYREYSILSNIKVDNKFFVSTNGKEKFIKIGDPNILVENRVDYLITYDYKMNDDQMPDSDEYYFNIIGTEWATKIEEANFSITLPKNFNPDDVGLSVGTYGNSGYNGRAEFFVENNTIKGHITKPLNPNEGITIRVTLPEGYFEKNGLPYNKILGILGVVVLSFFAYINWYRYGKDKHCVPVITFNPPKNFNSAEIGSIFSETGASLNHVVSLIIYLAGKGYIAIETEKKFFNNNFTLYKQKDYVGENIEEKELMVALFKHSDRITKEELEKSKSFYKDCNQIVEFLNQKRKKYFEDIGLSKYLQMYGYWFAILILSIFSILGFDVFVANIGIVFFVFILNFFMLIALFTIRGRIFRYIASALMFCCLISLSLTFDGVELSLSTYSTIIIDIICYIITSVCFVNMQKRNEIGDMLYREILGFKHFLQVSEKSRLEILLKENINYYNDILPYAYVFDISNVIINKFKDLIPICPNWYSGEEFNSNRFNTLVSDLYSLTCPSVTNGGVKNSSSSSGGGGGHSGGGGGGGGGHSW